MNFATQEGVSATITAALVRSTAMRSAVLPRVQPNHEKPMIMIPTAPTTTPQAAGLNHGTYSQQDHASGWRDLGRVSSRSAGAGTPRRCRTRVPPPQDRDVQLADDDRREKPGGNGDHVASVGAAPFGEHADEENTAGENTGMGADKLEAR
jgi:hypothetical protein